MSVRNLTMDWSKDDCLRAVDLYKSEPVLWSRKHPLYYDKKRKSMAWNTVASAMNVDVPTFKRKMNSLLGSFRRERTKLCRINATGCLAEGYTSHWFAYDRMQFLCQDSADRDYLDTSAEIVYYENNDEYDVHGTSDNSHDVSVKNEPVSVSIKNESKGYEESDDFADVDNSINEKYAELRTVAGMSNQAPIRKAILANALKAENHQQSIMDQTASSSQLSDDVFTVYGQYIANKLRGYDAVTQAVVEHAINDILFGADLGKYSEVPKLYKSFTHSSVPVYKPEPDDTYSENVDGSSSPTEMKPDV